MRGSGPALTFPLPSPGPSSDIRGQKFENCCDSQFDAWAPDFESQAQEDAILGKQVVGSIFSKNFIFSANVGLNRQDSWPKMLTSQIYPILPIWGNL